MKPFPCRLLSIGLAATLPLFLLTACNKESHAGTASKPSMTDQAKAGYAEFQKSASEALASTDKKIAELRTKASSATESAKVELDKTLASLEEKRQAVGNRISELKNEAPEKAQAMVDKLKTELAELKKATEDAVAKFK